MEAHVILQLMLVDFRFWRGQKMTSFDYLIKTSSMECQAVNRTFHSDRDSSILLHCVALSGRQGGRGHFLVWGPLDALKLAASCVSELSHHVSSFQGVHVHQTVDVQRDVWILKIRNVQIRCISCILLALPMTIHAKEMRQAGIEPDTVAWNCDLAGLQFWGLSNTHDMCGW